MVRMLVFLVLSVLSWIVMMGMVVAACFTFFPSPSNAAVESVSALAREYLPSDIWYSSAAAQASSVLAHIAQSPSAWLTGLILARVAIAVAHFLLRMSLYRPIVIRPRKYY
jgi:hypothetical protein